MPHFGRRRAGVRTSDAPSGTHQPGGASMATDVVIVSAARTPIATAYKGSLLGVDAFSLAETAIGAAVKRSGIPADQFEDMGVGESMQGGGNIGRNVAVRLG